MQHDRSAADGARRGDRHPDGWSRDASPDTIRVALFAGMADLAGVRAVSLPWRGGTVADLRRSLAAAYPALGPLLDRSAVAVGAAYVRDDAAVTSAADVAIIPPVSGG